MAGGSSPGSGSGAVLVDGSGEAVLPAYAGEGVGAVPPPVGGPHFAEWDGTRLVPLTPMQWDGEKLVPLEVKVF